MIWRWTSTIIYEVGKFGSIRVSVEFFSGVFSCFFSSFEAPNPLGLLRRACGFNISLDVQTSRRLLGCLSKIRAVTLRSASSVGISNIGNVPDHSELLKGEFVV